MAFMRSSVRARSGPPSWTNSRIFTLRFWLAVEAGLWSKPSGESPVTVFLRSTYGDSCIIRHSGESRNPEVLHYPQLLNVSF